VNPELRLNYAAVGPPPLYKDADVEEFTSRAVGFSVSMRLVLICFAVLVVAAAAADPALELRGRIEPPLRAAVALYGSTHPFQKHVLSNAKGRFRFKNLSAGTYTVSIFHPRRGEFRRTVEVTPSFAGRNRRVEITIPFAPSKGEPERALARTNTVGARVLSIDPKAANLLAAARNMLAKGRPGDAAADLRKAVELSPQFVEAWNLLGTISYQRGNYAQAEREFRSALEHDDDAFEPTVNLGGTLLSMGRHQDALPYNQYAVLARPESALANSQMGMNHFFLGEPARALEYLEKAKRIDPSHFSHPQLMLAQLHAQHGRAPEAIKELEDFLRRHPDSTSVDQVQQSIENLRNVTADRP
jgi:Flp pilus assembly protein TadD